MSGAKYAIGIDLGTTHSALSWVDLHSEGAAPEILPIAQQSGPGAVQDYSLLPSFLYVPHDSEFAPGDLALPWNAAPGRITGEWARSHGALTPIRLVSSAKSWLGHAGMDRRAGILPADAPPEVERISPLAASTHYLQHLRDAWNHRHPEAPFDQQSVTVTIPASFDPAARELTAEAAQAAGYQGITLLEEPQAALYSWIAGSAGDWRKQVQVGDVILVVDVGGGTSDFSLIAVTEDAGNLQLNRVAVGEHILLGGDNMDLALAHGVARGLAAEGKQLDPWQMRALTYACRLAKEQLLSDPGLQSVPLVVPSRGSKLIGGSIRTELQRELLSTILLEGFFPAVESSAWPITRPRAGLTQIGLPYAQDAAVTRHLAALLGRQVGATAQLPGFAQPEGATFLHPTAVLFNGGVFKSELLADRVLSTLNAWLAADGAPAARLLQGADMDHAVARGAAYYGQVRQGRGIRIRGGTAQAYYVGIESSMPAVPGLEPPVQALCVAPFGMEEGSEAPLPPQQLGLVVGESVRFRFFGSSVRRDDQPGTLLDFWSPEELQELAQIEATLPAEGRAAGEVVPVQLRARVTDIGTLELLAQASVGASGGAQWKVEFDVRDA
ncbi:nucleotide-binding protein [Paracidovorax avenae]|uniref:Hsp70 family protein n=1 Tax=Paracidovorax avenae TaxID=80867 RepID=UPI000D151BF8|nr:Hsp70 family protein [Paracidovorax avenae]AVT17481.1 nucleotide-binding protein [Paracidovorax avenae]